MMALMANWPDISSDIVIKRLFAIKNGTFFSTELRNYVLPDICPCADKQINLEADGRLHVGVNDGRLD